MVSANFTSEDHVQSSRTDFQYPPIYYEIIKKRKKKVFQYNHIFVTHLTHSVLRLIYMTNYYDVVVINCWLKTPRGRVHLYINKIMKSIPKAVHNDGKFQGDKILEINYLAIDRISNLLQLFNTVIIK